LPEPDSSIQAIQEPSAVKLDTNITPELKREGLMREIVRNVQQARKQAGLEVDDRIDLVLESADAKLTSILSVNTLTDEIKRETLATSLNEHNVDKFATQVKIEDADLTIKLAKTTTP
jgi:isoleucyl-tRNA synthetase